MTIQCIRDGKTPLTVPGITLFGDIPYSTSSACYFISKAACLAASLDPKAVQEEFKSGKRSRENAEDAGLLLRMGLNPCGLLIVDDAEESERRHAEYARQAEADKRIKFASQIEEARGSGKNVTVHTEKWTENRRAKEGGEWGDYLFCCSRTEWVTPTGEFQSKTTAVNSY